MVVNIKGVFIAGILLSLIGISLLVISFALLPKVLKTATDNAIIDAIIVDSYNSEQYKDWAGQKSIDNYYKQYYYLWNLTNPTEVLLGKKAIYENVGPFNYKYEWVYNNVSFTDDGNLATYTQTKSYTWVEDEDTLNPYTVSTTNLNPAYMGLLSTLSLNSIMGMPAEKILFILASAPQTKIFIDYLSNDNFIEIAYFFNGPKYFSIQYQQLLNSINGSSSLPNTTTPIEYFYEQWSNSTSIPTIGNPTLWNNMTVSFGLDVPSGISLESASQILDPENEYSLLNINTGIEYWISAIMNGPDSQSYRLLEDKLGIDQAQVTLVTVWWLKGFNIQYTLPNLLESCGIPSLKYLGICQFVTAIPLGYKSITNLNIPNLPWSQPFELAVAMNTNLTISSMQAQTNLFNNGSNSLLTVQGLGAFTSQANTMNFTQWNITQNDASTLLGYFIYYLPTSTGYSTRSVQSLYSRAGLIVTRTANQWLWDCSDDLLNFLGVQQSCSLQQNNTVDLPSTVYTGKKDVSKTNYIKEYQEQTVLSMWNNGTVEVRGYTETGQMAPLQGTPSTITIFDENVFRPLDMIHSAPTSVKGIDTQRYYLSNNSFPINPVFNNSINGFANLTGLFNNVPIFVSLWDMYGVASDFSSSNIQGLNQTFENSAIPLDLEPITGNALYFNIKLQVNLEIPSNAQTSWFDPSGNWTNINTGNNGIGIFYPVLKVGQTATASNNDINTLKQQFKQIQTVKITPVVVVSIFGGILLISGLFSLILSLRKFLQQRHNGYQIIN